MYDMNPYGGSRLIKIDFILILVTISLPNPSGTKHWHAQYLRNYGSIFLVPQSHKWCNTANNMDMIKMFQIYIWRNAIHNTLNNSIILFWGIENYKTSLLKNILSWEAWWSRTDKLIFCSFLQKPSKSCAFIYQEFAFLMSLVETECETSNIFCFLEKIKLFWVLVLQ